MSRRPSSGSRRTYSRRRGDAPYTARRRCFRAPFHSLHRRRIHPARGWRHATRRGSRHPRQPSAHGGSYHPGTGFRRCGIPAAYARIRHRPAAISRGRPSRRIARRHRCRPTPRISARRARGAASRRLPHFRASAPGKAAHSSGYRGLRRSSTAANAAISSGSQAGRNSVRGSATARYGVRQAPAWEPRARTGGRRAAAANG